tara:strand:+ start:339 stop:530 length:192 start_codon:yes stop_codon:yes gene_type:complete
MTIREVMQMTNDFPADRTVPAKLKKEIDKATGSDKIFLQRLVEGLFVTAKSPEDIAAIRKVFK